MDIGAHAFRLMDLTNDDLIMELLGERRLARDTLSAVCEACPNLLWERS